MDNENLKIYNLVKEVPENAKKEITAGRLKGMTDINPMWRIKMLTEIFGACGVGWYYNIKNKEIIDGANNEKIAIVDIELYIKSNNEWSKPIEGTGGSAFIANETKGLHTSDECYKMALTDALSVACKALGFGADVYWNENKSKYGNGKPTNQPNNSKPKEDKTISLAQRKRLFTIANNNAELVKQVIEEKGYTESKQIKVSDYDEICNRVENMMTE